VEEFNQVGGARVGRSPWRASNATWPFAKLRATRQSLALELPLRRFIFERGCIRQLKPFRGFFTIGLQILHAREDYPPFIVFWTFNFSLLRSELQKLGYGVVNLHP